MKRSPIKRSEPKRLTPEQITARLASLRKLQAGQKPLKLGAPPKQRKPVKARRTGKPRRQSGKCPDLLAWLRTQPCFVTGSRNAVVVAHLPRVRRHGDLNNALPLNDWWHRCQHQWGVATFAVTVGHTMESLQALATQYTARFFGLHPEIAAKCSGPQGSLTP